MMRVPAGIGTTLLLCIPLFAQHTSLSRSEIEQQMQTLQTREQQLREQIAAEQTTILSLKKKIETSRQRIASLRKKKLEMVGITEQGLAEFSRRVKHLEQELSLLLRSGDDEFVADSIRFQTLVAQAGKVKNNPASRFRSLRASIDAISRSVSSAQERYEGLREVRETAAEPVADARPAEEVAASLTGTTYTVMNGDGVPETLYSIAGKVYGDPFQWVRIYEANKAVLDSNFNRIRNRTELKSIAEPSDLIFPGQVLAIPR